jgi:hypothetical protein
MTNGHASGFNPAALNALRGAFDTAWDEVRIHASDANRDAARDAIGKAIVGLARTGYRNPEHLARYGAYQGRLFIDLRG